MARKKNPSDDHEPSRDPAQIARLIEKCRQGDAAAADAIFARYLNRLTALARSRLSRRLAARFDASDVVMSAYRSFFVGLRERGFAIAGENDLWQLLVQITLRKLYRQATKHTAARRAADRDVTLQLPDGSILAIPGREPRPDEAAAAADEVEFLLAPLPPIARIIFELRLQGEAIAAIADHVQVNERTVRRWLDRIKQELMSRRDTINADLPPNHESNVHRESANQVCRAKTSKRPAILKTKRQIVRRSSNQCVKLRSLSTLDYKDYTLQRMIGAGASGKIYRAFCRKDEQTYALKFLRKTFTTDRAAIRRFVAEYSIVANLKHRNIMPVLGFGRTPSGGYFFAMEFADGDLQRRIVARRIPVRHAVNWIRQAAVGVRSAHEHRVIHRDLKPSNLLLSSANEVLVSDFGLACRLDDLPHRGQFAGTPAFMAPEQINLAGSGASPQTDVYGLGATLYALLTGRPPFIGDRVSDIIVQVLSSKSPTAPSEIRSRLPANIERVCLKCLQKKIGDRYSSVDEFLESLDACGLHKGDSKR